MKKFIACVLACLLLTLPLSVFADAPEEKPADNRSEIVKPFCLHPDQEKFIAN